MQHIMSSGRDIAEAMVAQAAADAQRHANATTGTTSDGSAEAAALAAHGGWLADVASGGDSETRAHKTEFTSPAPPHELSFAREGAAEVSCVLRLVRSLGATAPSLSRVWHGGASMHVHVNVASSCARGDVLSAREILNVVRHRRSD
jgi:hypothetical protein